MGTKLDKIESINMGDNFPLYAVDLSKAGTCYLCVHNQNESAEKEKHHSLFVDVAGETRIGEMGSIKQLVGLMLHVTAKPLTRRTKYRFGRIKINGKNDLIYTIGQLCKTQDITPGQWASQIRDIGEQVYINLVRINNNQELWTLNLNCQIFVKKMIEYLNLRYPSTILSCLDLPPPIVDFSILCLRSSAHAKSKLTTTTTAAANDDDDSDDDSN